MDLNKHRMSIKTNDAHDLGAIKSIRKRLIIFLNIMYLCSYLKVCSRYRQFHLATSPSIYSTYLGILICIGGSCRRGIALKSRICLSKGHCESCYKQCNKNVIKLHVKFNILPM